MRLAALGFAVALLPLSCEPRLSKIEYTTRADGICAKYNRKIRALGQPRRVKDLPQYVNRALPVAKKGNEELRALQPPRAEAGTAAEWLDQNQAVIAALERVREAAKRGDRAAIEAALSEAGAANRRANRLARQLDLRICARG